MSVYRNTVFIAKGLLEYTKGGYTSASKNFNATDLDVDCSLKHFLITGSNSGIGKQTALEIAKRGGIVHLVCRNPDSAEQAKNEITDESKNSNVYTHILDLSKPRDVHKFSEHLSTEFASSGLHVLVNNAGAMVNKRTLTDEGLETNFATNTLGVYILTEQLIPLLRKASSANFRPRVITVSSGGMLTNKLDAADLQFENMNPFDGTMAYAQNKRQQVIMTEEWAKKYSDIQFTTMHPGWTDTPAVRTSMPGFYEKMKNRLRTVEQGADTMVWLAITENEAAVNLANAGEFYQDRCVVAKHYPLAWTRASQPEKDKLMSELEKLSSQFSN